MKLAVLLSGEWIGLLQSTPDRGIVFKYASEYVLEPDSVPLSQSLPLREREFAQAQSLPFFSGLLPEGEVRRRIADDLHLSEMSHLRLLEALGGECAGVVSLFSVEDDETIPPAAETGGYSEIPSGELETMILNSERSPLLLPKMGARLSLAGAQEKIPLLLKDGRWYRPLGNSPSSHILKPASSRFPEIAFNEFASMRLAGMLGLPAAQVEIASIGKPVLVIERYDRHLLPDGSLSRLHQEDFCQALGMMPDRKYEGDGGPGFAAIADLIRKVCGNPLAEMEKLIDIAIYNALLGNCDAHGKNFSLQYEGRRTTLAPFYDLLSTTFWPELDTKLSMRIGNQTRIDSVQEADLEDFARTLKVKPGVVVDKAHRLIDGANSAWECMGALPELDGHQPLLMALRKGWAERATRLFQ